MLGAWVAGTLLALSALPARSAEPTQTAGTEAPDKIIAALRQITGELTDSVKQFEAHLDREIALHDRGYRSTDGRRIPARTPIFSAGLPTWPCRPYISSLPRA